MSGKPFAITVIIVAILIALIAIIVPTGYLHDYITVMSFFEGMIPILGVGALVKYLLDL